MCYTVREPLFGSPWHQGECEMAQTPSIIQGETLVYQQDEQPAQLVVGTSGWFSWLETASTFTFRSEHGTFSARKERAGNKRGRSYWRAYRKRNGKLHRAYLGKSEELTLERLKVVAALLEGAGAGYNPLAVPARATGASVPPVASSRASGRLRLQTQTSLSQRAKAGRPSSATDRVSIRPSSDLLMPLTSLIGREQQVQAICAMLQRPEVRLLTLTGTGGVGKTRLGLAVAHALLGVFADGVCFVPLTPVIDPERVIATIAQALGLWEVGDRPLIEQLQAYLQDRHLLLLLLDNFEQVVAAAPALADLLAFCPELHLLVTSRAVLHISGEYEFPVAPLAVPDLTQVPDHEVLAQVAAVSLFVQRAQATQPSFTLTRSNAHTIAEICVRLDGLPLAIELAAARIKLLPPQALLKRLEHRFSVLTGGARNLPLRQQTLRNTIQWSYDLLSAEERRLFRWLSVFVGGCTLKAAAAVYNAGTDQVTELFEEVASLVDKSLIQQTEQEGEEPRLLMLETIREYGLECLRERGELEAAQRAHAAYYLWLAEEAEPHLVRAEQALWFERLEREMENIRAVLRWAQTCGNEEAQLALRLGSALEQFWIKRGNMSEGRSELSRALAQSLAVKAPLRAKALFAAARLAWFQGDYRGVGQLSEEVSALSGELAEQQSIALALAVQGVAFMGRRDYERARSLLEEALAKLRGGGDSWHVAFLLMGLGRLTLYQREDNNAAHLLQESLALFRAVGDTTATAYVLFYLARAMLGQGDLVRARALLEESLPLYREAGHKLGMAYALGFLGQIVFQQGEVGMADALFNESIQLHRAMGDRRGESRSLLHWAHLGVYQQDYAAARSRYEESLTLSQALGHKGLIAAGLKGLAVVATAQGLPIASVRLWGAAETVDQDSAVSLPLVLRASVEQAQARARSYLGEQAFTQAWAEGRRMSPEQALATLRTAKANPPVETKQTHASPGGLTAREVEVLRFVAKGMTDAQVAEQLIISPRTVNWHLTSIYNKLGINSRVAAARFAVEHQLV